MENEQHYGASDIQVLEGLEAVRKRPGMYIGTTDVKGLHHLVWEIVDNSIDEALAGYCTHIEVIINKDNSVTVKDDGRGIPVDIHPKTKISTVETVYTVLHAGGKFGGGGYKVSGGLHGVGASVVNALSKWVEVKVYKNGKIYFVRFENGGHIVEPLKVIGDCEENRTGTTVTFKPDSDIFDTDIFDYDTLKVRIRELAFLNKGLRITLRDDRDMEDTTGETFMYEGGISEYVKFINQNKTPIHDDIIDVSGVDKDISIGGLHIFPLPSSHCKGCLGLEVDETYAFVGDALYSKARDGYYVFNAQLVKEEIAVLKGLKAPYLLVSHYKGLIRPRDEAIAELEALYRSWDKSSAEIKVM